MDSVYIIVSQSKLVVTAVAMATARELFGGAAIDT